MMRITLWPATLVSEIQRRPSRVTSSTTARLATLVCSSSPGARTRQFKIGRRSRVGSIHVEPQFMSAANGGSSFQIINGARVSGAGGGHHSEGNFSAGNIGGYGRFQLF